MKLQSRSAVFFLAIFFFLQSSIFIPISGRAGDSPSRIKSSEFQARTQLKEGLRTFYLSGAFSKKDFRSWEDLIGYVQARVFAQYPLIPAASVQSDPECSSNPLFSFAGDIYVRAENMAAKKTKGIQRLSRIRADRSAAKNLSNFISKKLDERDIVRKFIRDMDQKDFGTYVRHLGIYNNALVCSGDNSQRVLDYLLAAIFYVTLQSDLDRAEQRKIIKGLFNPALNTFDHRQYTGISLLQGVISREIETVKALLMADYPVCELGVFVFDFAAGKLVRLRDENLCRAVKKTRLRRTTPSPNSPRSENAETLRQKQKEKFLEGFLKMFEDPRRFGTGSCSLLRSSASDFKCLAGLACGRGQAPAGLSGSSRLVSNISNANPASNSSLRGMSPASSISTVQPRGLGNPKKFGIPMALTRQFLCSGAGIREGQEEDHSKGAFGRADWMVDPEKNLFQCQASLLFASLQDKTTSCLIHAIRDILDLERRAGQDPSVVIGGFKDPTCGAGENRHKRKAREWIEQLKKGGEVPGEGVVLVDPYRIGTRPEDEADEARFSNIVTASDAAMHEKIAGMALDWIQKGVIGNEIKYAQAVNTAIETPIVLVYGLGEAGRAPAIALRDSSSPTGWTIYLDFAFLKDQAKAVKALNQVRQEIINKELGLPSEEKSKKRRAENTEPASGRLEDEEKNTDPGFFEDGGSDACTSALARAEQVLTKCITPKRSEESAAPGDQPPGADPTLINPNPDATFLSAATKLDLSACVDQYGKDIRYLSGAAYGPGGCLPPVTTCSSTACTAHPSNCDFWGQWQCSYALCREDAHCCGSPQSSRGGGPGATSGNRISGQIQCGDGQTWNPVKKRCEAGNICPPGMQFNPGTHACSPAEPGPGRPGRPGGPE